MKNKKEVYVKVDTPKKAKKLKKVLDMFGEKYGSRTFELLENKEGGKVYFNMLLEWNTDVVLMVHRRRQEVSIKELKNILAVEHLKEGDIVVAGIGSTKYVVNVENVGVSNAIPIRGNKWICIDGDDYPYEIKKGYGGFNNFIRYATEEEKQLLNPKKELEVGKWYKTGRTLFNHQSGYNSYGFLDNNWNLNDWRTNLDDFEFVTPIEANPQEVEQKLIEEAKTRGFVNGFIGNNSNIHNKNLKDCELFFNNEYEFDNKDNLLRVILDEYTTWTVFKDGQWATIIEQDKFAELKESHSNWAVIQIKDMFGVWHYVSDDSLWLTDKEYRIKPQATFTDKDVGIIEQLHDTLLDNHKYDLQSYLLIEARMLADKIKSNIK